MSNKERFLWGGSAAILVFLYLLSSTDLIIKEKKKEIYPISVIIEDTNDEYYANFRKGMDKAAEKLQADVSFITLYQDNSEEEQMELLLREVKDGARAVILSPVNETGVVMRLDEAKPNCPVILLGSSLIDSSVAASISIDGYETGRLLGEEVAKREKAEVPVWLLSEGLSYTGNIDVYDGIRSVLDERGYSCRLIEKKSEDTYRTAIEEMVYPGSKEAVIIALDVESLDIVSAILEGSTVYAGCVKGLYGVGSTTAILQRLEKGIVKGLMAENRYNEGYLSILSAVEAIQGGWTKSHIPVESFYIERKDLRDPAYEKLLYPIE